MKKLTAKSIIASAALAITAHATAAPADLVIKESPHSDGKGMSYSVARGKTQLGNLNVSCETGFVALNKIGDTTATRIVDGKASLIDNDPSAPVIVSTPIAMPPDLNPAVLCTDGKPNRANAQNALRARFGSSTP